MFHSLRALWSASEWWDRLWLLFGFIVIAVAVLKQDVVVALVGLILLGVTHENLNLRVENLMLRDKLESTEEALQINEDAYDFLVERTLMPYREKASKKK